ncbi:MAG: site-2 protease family protein [Actinomycetota bacterium]|jgi:Zn-dependent protease|nr:site-2 protease family protein [Actinomycetota bacterium]
MRPSVRLGTISGIRVGLHWSVALVALLFTSTLAGSILPDAAPGFRGEAYLMVALSTSALLLASIVAHEFGHSIVARRNGVGIKGITLFALGGVATMEREPERPGAAFRIAAAGPMVSVIIGALSFAAALGVERAGLSDLTVAAVLWLGVVNLGLAVFNMLPALPLDGGRVLQSALWKRSGDRLAATVTAATVGRVLGNLMMMVGLYLVLADRSGLWTVFIGWFVSSGAKGEELRARHQMRQREAQPTGPIVTGDVIDID